MNKKLFFVCVPGIKDVDQVYVVTAVSPLPSFFSGETILNFRVPQMGMFTFVLRMFLMLRTSMVSTLVLFVVKFSMPKMELFLMILGRAPVSTISISRCIARSSRRLSVF